MLFAVDVPACRTARTLSVSARRTWTPARLGASGTVTPAPHSSPVHQPTYETDHTTVQRAAALANFYLIIPEGRQIKNLTIAAAR